MVAVSQVHRATFCGSKGDVCTMEIIHGPSWAPSYRDKKRRTSFDFERGGYIYYPFDWLRAKGISMLNALSKCEKRIYEKFFDARRNDSLRMRKASYSGCHAFAVTSSPSSGISSYLR